MQKFKNKWEITKNWQLIHPILGMLATIFSAYLIARTVSLKIADYGSLVYGVILAMLLLIISFLILKISFWCFKKLENKWKVSYRWEYIAIFLCFAVTGSTAGRISDPIMGIIGLTKNTTSGWLYWPVRILLIFPVYQVLLVIFGWIFGQYKFFKQFAIKMVSRMGLGFIFKA